MQDWNSPQSEPRDATPAQPSAELEDSWVQPSSSRMLTNYLADVEQNLDEHRWELALRDVADLPKIAVALTDPELRSSGERCKAWCEQWVRPRMPRTIPVVWTTRASVASWTRSQGTLGQHQRCHQRSCAACGCAGMPAMRLAASMLRTPAKKTRMEPRLSRSVRPWWKAFVAGTRISPATTPRRRPIWRASPS